MQAQIYLRRRYGQRIANETSVPPLVGDLQFSHVMYAKDQVAVLELHASGNTSKDSGLARLYEPVMIGLGGWWLSFRGFESVASDGGPIGYVQEWRCYLIAPDSTARA